MIDIRAQNAAESEPEMDRLKAENEELWNLLVDLVEAPTFILSGPKIKRFKATYDIARKYLDSRGVGA